MYEQVLLGQKPEGEVQIVERDGIQYKAVQFTHTINEGLNIPPREELVMYHCTESNHDHGARLRFLSWQVLCHKPICGVCHMPILGTEPTIHFYRHRDTSAFISQYAHDNCVVALMEGITEGNEVRRPRNSCRCQICKKMTKQAILAELPSEWPQNVGMCIPCYIEMCNKGPAPSNIRMVNYHTWRRRHSPTDWDMEDRYEMYLKFTQLPQCVRIERAKMFDVKNKVAFIPEGETLELTDIRDMAISPALSPFLLALAKEVQFYELEASLFYLIGKTRQREFVNIPVVKEALQRSPGSMRRSAQVKVAQLLWLGV